jgi:hypothetical protein
MMAVWIALGSIAVLVALIIWRASKLGTVREAISELLTLVWLFR